MNILMKHFTVGILIALSVGHAGAQEPARQQLLVTISISHSGHLVTEGPLVFYAGQTTQNDTPTSTYASLSEIGYPAIDCSHSADKATRNFHSVMLKSGYTMAASLDAQQQKITIKINRFDVEGATEQVLAEMRKPIQTCRSIQPQQVVSLTQTITIPASTGIGIIILKNGDALRYTVAAASP